jgi:hypothetical protein
MAIIHDLGADGVLRPRLLTLDQRFEEHDVAG